MNHSLEINLFLFCPVKRQSTGQVATSEYHSRRASPETTKKSESGTI